MTARASGEGSGVNGDGAAAEPATAAAAPRDPPHATPRPPADLGLSSLGLVLTVTGAVMAPLGAAMMVQVWLGERTGENERGLPPMAWLLALVIALTIARSLAQRAAGLRLWRATPGAPPALGGVRRYVGVAALHTAAIVAYSAVRWERVPLEVTGLAAASLAWPLAVLALTSGRAVRALGAAPPMAEDRGLEGLAVIMACFALNGLAVAALVLALGLVSDRGETTAFLVGSSALLGVRSGLHLATAAGALRREPWAAGPAFVRWADRATVLGAVVGGAGVLFTLITTVDAIEAAQMVAVLLALLAWPLLVRRFVTWRELTEADRGGVVRPAPDGGLTALGWLLVATGAVTAGNLAAAWLDTPHELLSWLLPVSGLFRSPPTWWMTALVATQLWAGVALVRVSASRRWVATGWAVAQVAINLYEGRWVLTALDQPLRAVHLQGMAVLAALLALPVFTLVMVHRRLTRVDLASTFA